jgi:hypothetical protein
MEGDRGWMESTRITARPTGGNLHAAFSGSLRLSWLLLRVDGVIDPPGHHWPTGELADKELRQAAIAHLHTRLSGIPDSARRTRIATLTRLTSPYSMWVHTSNHQERGSA